MLEVHFIRQHKETVIERLSKRGIDATEDIEKVLTLDEQRRNLQKQTDELLGQSNVMAKQIGDLFKSGKQEEGNSMRAKAAELRDQSHAKKDELHAAEAALKDLLFHLPNMPQEAVPPGNDEEDNEIIFEEGEVPTLHEGAKAHWDLIEDYTLIDFPLGVKITGAGFPVYRGKGAKLQRALINFFLDEAMEAGYEEFLPPHLINEASGIGTGQLPDKEGQMYHATADGLYLIPTAEVPITNIYRDVMLKEDEFPIKMCAYTPCFRREAGAWGAHVRGLNRLHQFDKVEIVQVEHPERSEATLDTMVEHIKNLLRKLELPFRVARLCGGDLGFAASITYDLEVYSAAQKRWLEVSSVSNFATFQANRLKLRFKDSDGKRHLAHTLNGSALALPRIVAALLENHQTPEGIRVPEALVPYTGFDMISQ